MNHNGRMETKIQIADALQDLMEKKPFQKITVNELCQKANVHRSTFYLHFNDKYDLLLFLLERLFEEFEKNLYTQEPLEFLIAFLGYFQSKDNVFSHMISFGLDMELRTTLQDFLKNHFIKHLYEKNAGKLLLPGPTDYIADFYVGGLTTTIFRWMKSGYKIPKERLAACQYHLLKDIWK